MRLAAAPPGSGSRARRLRARLVFAGPVAYVGLEHIVFELLRGYDGLGHIVERYDAEQHGPIHDRDVARMQIGRASCRERVVSVRVDLGGRRFIKKKNT